MVVNYQSWLDPFIIICALPGAFTGIVWALFLTQTTFNVPSLMGAIMSIGVATANSILLVTFANELRATGVAPFEAAVTAGFTRLRPIIMTAFAMIIGMLPYGPLASAKRRTECSARSRRDRRSQRRYLRHALLRSSDVYVDPRKK